MRSHQILTGACNSGDRTFSVGSVEGISFTAYAAGCNIVILAKDFTRVQIIPGICHENIQILCVDCSLDTGRISAAYEDHIIIFEPVPISEKSSDHGLDYWWVETARISAECTVSTLSWNNEGNRLITAGNIIQLWTDDSENKVQFDIEEPSSSWKCIWNVYPPNPIVYLAFSPDGSLFATSGKNDRLARIWYQNQPIILSDYHHCLSISFSYIYIAHPQSITGMSWRNTSKYMPRGTVSNVLVTSCLDNICRIWSETLLPEDGIVSMQHLDPPVTGNAKYRTHKQKDRYLQRLKHIRQNYMVRQMNKTQTLENTMEPVIPTLPSNCNSHDFHNYGFQCTGPNHGGIHFHLSATINGLMDIPLVPKMGSASKTTLQNTQNFVLHWMNNKEMQFVIDTEKILEELLSLVINKGNDESKSEDLTSLSEGSASLHEALDCRIDKILQEWHSQSDLLYSIHPVDGSLCIWIAEYLDEIMPGNYRQTQVSFSSRIPNAFPFGDAMTLSSNVSLYNARQSDFYKRKVKGDKKYLGESSVFMISKHTNGTLNLWNLMFANKSKFSQVLNISHTSRASGHRFRVNGIICHPVLPLLLTTSHHNMLKDPCVHQEQSFCSELILWRVDPVGPLCSSGGIYELARINSPDVSAFTDVAWIPTLLPSTTLGNVSNSPSAAFVSSNGNNLIVYLAVIDARNLLAQINSESRKQYSEDSEVELNITNTFEKNEFSSKITEKFNIVSTQSSDKPGCIIELKTIMEASHNWSNTLMIHCFQEQLFMSHQILVQGKRNIYNNIVSNQMSATVDLQTGNCFREPFNVLVVEKTESKTLMHMWELILSSRCEINGRDSIGIFPLFKSLSLENEYYEGNTCDDVSAYEVNVDSQKLSTFSLPLPNEVEVIHVVPAVGHLSSSSIYPACLAPYLLITACSDNTLRFWKTKGTNSLNKKNFEWEEWKMECENGSSSITIPGRPVSISAAYSARIACAYQMGNSFIRVTENGEANVRYVNLVVSIYECESTGGSEWILDDTIYLKNIELSPKIPSIDLSTTSFPSQPNIPESKKLITNRLRSRPSVSTFECVRKYIQRMGNTPSPNAPKQSVILDWVSNEDGSHLLTIAVGNKILFLTKVNSEVSRRSQSSKSSLLRRSSFSNSPKDLTEIRWMQIRKICLNTADGLNPTPMATSWVRDGILVVGMDNEISVYSQWKDDVTFSLMDEEDDDVFDERQLPKNEILNRAQESQIKIRNVSSFSSLSNGALLKHMKDHDKKKKGVIYEESDLMPDIGLFEVSSLACPVLPQYHPKQLMELLNSGKIRWVKAILGHLVRCISGSKSSTEDNSWSRSRTLSIIGNSSGIPSPGNDVFRSSGGMREEITLNYTVIKSIPILPLWRLLLADQETLKSNGSLEGLRNQYENLFDETAAEASHLDSSEFWSEGKPVQKTFEENQGLSYFGPRQAQILSNRLTHAHLPGLTSLDQMHLLALADTVSSSELDFADKFAIHESNSHSNSSKASLDDCGLRFVLAMKHFTYLHRCLPLPQRKLLSGLNTSNLVWGFHSESEEDLLNNIPSVLKGNPTWAELKELGIPWWIRNTTTLRKLIEKVAKAAFQANNDPLDAAIFYLAMRKKSLLANLFKSMKDVKMTAFFLNNFNEERWRKAALKNAFALLGKQRFLHGAAFFLLSGSLQDALDICIDKLHDLQLAMVISRLYDGELLPVPESYKNLLDSHILGHRYSLPNKNNEEEIKKNSHPDPFLRSISLWILQEYSESLETLVQTKIGQNHPSFQNKESRDNHSAVFNFYIYLRTHPLIIRQNLNKDRGMGLSGFQSKTDNMLSEEAMTPLERRLYFSTAHFHLLSGCPALALDVMSKLPNKVLKNKIISEKASTSSETKGKLSKGPEETIDWSKPVLNKSKNDLDDFKLEWSDDEAENDGKENDDDEKCENEKYTSKDVVDVTEEELAVLDIMAQQLKFISCMKIMMEELETLSSDVESNGGLLRTQLYIWLEREVEALKTLCNYGSTYIEPICCQNLNHSESAISLKRKLWLKSNQTLLRTLLSYCGLHGGGELSSIQLELIFLLQEFQQEKKWSQTYFPLPWTTTLPLLSACIAQQKTVVTNPIQFLRAKTQDVLTTISKEKRPPFPGSFTESSLIILRNYSLALSTCIYQSLCGDSNGVTTSLSHSDFKNHVDSSLISSRKKSLDEIGKDDIVTSEPSKWPGVTSLRALLDRDKDDDIPNLNVFLTETFVAIYLGMLCHALGSCDAHILYRLVGQTITPHYWSQIFGGGCKKSCKSTLTPPSLDLRSDSGGILSAVTSQVSKVVGSEVTSLAKQRNKLNMKLLGIQPQSTSLDEENLNLGSKCREYFKAPEISIINQLMNKPTTTWTNIIDYDSDNDSETDESDDEDIFPSSNEENTEHSNSMSYSWQLIRYAVISLAQKNIEKIVDVAGLDLTELPITSPLIYGCLRVMESWLEVIQESMGQRPNKYINGISSNNCASGPAIEKYKSLFEYQNTPFSTKNQKSLKNIKRLWHYLIRQESVQHVFILQLFGQLDSSHLKGGSTLNVSKRNEMTAMKVIHKENEGIAAFCISNVSNSHLALSTQRELQELNTSLLLNSDLWKKGMNSDADFDVLNLNEDPERFPSSNYLVIQAPGDSIEGDKLSPSSTNESSQFKGGNITTVKKYKCDGVRKMAAHTHLPLYITGSQDGSITLREWYHDVSVQIIQPPGIYARINQILFNLQGNKFGSCDGDGTVSLWQAANPSQPYFSMKCHNKTTNDFTFHGGCSSLFATAGHNSDGSNIGIWDTLMPKKRSNVCSFIFHDNGATAIRHVSEKQQLLTVGKKGLVSIWDIRQQKQLHYFKAHDYTIQCLAIDPNGDFFVTGSADGDIKVWSLSNYKCLGSYLEEHVKHGIFKNINQGVTQIHVDSDHRLYSCGADGSLKIRQLPDRDVILSYL